jgi:hypothetical protein
MGGSRSSGGWQPPRRYGPVGLRVGLGCAIIAAVCLAQLSTTSGADTSFIPGTATSGSQAIAVAPTVSSLSLGVILGTTLADYVNNEGQALAETFTAGTLETILEAANCQTGAPGSIKASDFPEPVQAESTNGPQTESASAYEPGNKNQTGAGTETATATPQPSGTATNDVTSLDLGGLIDIGGATSTSTAEVLNGDTRYATSESTVSSLSLDNGLIALNGLRWVATQTSGATNTSTATFTIGGLTVEGTNIPLTTDALNTAITVINTVLSPVGLQIVWPAVTTLPDGTINVSALKIGLDDSALGQEIIGPNLASAQTVRNVIQADLYDVNCNSATAFSVADVGVGILAGAGDLDIDLGGAHALTNDVAESSPFGPGSLSTTLPPVDNSLTTTPTSSFSFPGTPGTPAIPGTTGATTTPTTSSGQSKVALGPLEKSVSCSSLSTSGGSCSSSNLALPVGLIVLGLLLALVTLDYLRQRRYRRQSELEVS